MKDSKKYFISSKQWASWVAGGFFVISCILLLMFYGAFWKNAFYIHDIEHAVAFAGLVLAPLMTACFYILILPFGKKGSAWYICPITLWLFHEFVRACGISMGLCVLWTACVLLAWIVFFCAFMGKIKAITPLFWLIFIPLIVQSIRAAMHVPSAGMYMSLPRLSNISAWLGLLFFVFAMRREENGFLLRWNDRADGRRLRSLGPFSIIVPYLMVERRDSQNFFTDTIDVSEIDRYCREKRREGLKGFGIMHVFLAAYVRTAAMYPSINRFINGQHIFSRSFVEFIITIKKEMSIEGEETTLDFKFAPDATPMDVFYAMDEQIKENKKPQQSSSFDILIKLLTAIPGPILKFTIWFLKKLDYFGLLPTFLTDLSPFHGSAAFTSMGSLGIPPIVHHLYDFGNIPVFFALGKKYKKTEIDKDGTVHTRKYVDFTANTDERITDGYNYAVAIQQMKWFLMNPYALEEEIEVVQDVQ